RTDVAQGGDGVIADRGVFQGVNQGRHRGFRLRTKFAERLGGLGSQEGGMVNRLRSLLVALLRLVRPVLALERTSQSRHSSASHLAKRGDGRLGQLLAVFLQQSRKGRHRKLWISFHLPETLSGETTDEQVLVTLQRCHQSGTGL